jgi:LmbE family N-acetylglucosaminyl deacetylase
MNNNTGKKILILAPHTDDGELGCGGSISKYIEEQNEVYYVAFSLCKNSLPEGLAENTLEIEVKAATKILGIKEGNLILFDFEVRKFKENRQEILEELIKLRNRINPDLVFLPCSTDIHQDHQTIYEEGVRAFKQTSILGYEMPWNNISLQTTSFIKLSDFHIETKVKALEAYLSQKHRTYLNSNFIKSLATTRGVQIGHQYAEAFEVIRWIIN